jgi:hypothetical protein
MAKLAIAVFTACVLQIWTASVWAQTRQFANVVYDLPHGWEPNGNTEGRLELRYDDKDQCVNCRILIDPGADDGGPIQEWRNMKATPHEKMRVIGNPQFRQDTIGDWPVAVMLRQVKDGGRAKFQAYFAIDLPKRNELIIFEGSARDEETFNRSLATLNKHIPPLLNDLRFISEGAEPVLGPPTPGDLKGPWFGTAIRNQYNGFSGTLDLVVDKKLMTFYPDGRFFGGIPPTGAGPVDFAALVISGETNLGNYIVVGDTIELRFADGDVSRMRIINDTTIDMGRVKIHPAKFPADGFRFEGVIQSSRYTALGPGISGGVGSDRKQVFRRDGTYLDSSFVGAFGSFDSGGGFTTTNKQPEQLGHYEVANRFITLTPPKGEPLTTWIILEGGTSVIIGGQPVSALPQ